MCTLILAPAVWPRARLVVAANRDELLARPAGPPALVPGPIPALAPRDLVAGGSWIGLNAAGLFVGVTNRHLRQGPSVIDPARRSRGALVLDALACGSARDAVSRVRSFGGAAHNPFHLALVDASNSLVIWSDGETLSEVTLEPGRLHVLTERSFGAAPSAREDGLRARFDALAAGPEPTMECWRALLAQRGERPADADPRAPFDDVNVAVPAWGYGTRSATYARLGGDGAATYASIEGAPHTGPFVGVPLPWAG